MKKLIITIVLILMLSPVLPQALAWQIERPHRGVPLDIYDSLRHVQKKNTDGYASVGLGVAIDQYIEDFDHYGGSDFISLNLSMTANSRKYITYNLYSQSLWWIDEDELWYKNVMTGVGDDWGCWMDIPNDCGGCQVVLRFYGGHGSGEYTRVWVSSNGFIAFDLSNSTNPSPSSIPNTESPNAVIAPLWTDLNIDGSASIITGIWTLMSHSYFVVIWKNALHNASGERLTFQLILENAPGYYPADTRYHQSDIWMSYKAVSAITTDFTVGIEDHEGMKGHGGLCSGGSLEGLSGYTLHFSRYASSYFLKKLTLTFYDTCPQTRINIKEEGQLVPRGCNIQRDITKPAEPAPPHLFGVALAGTAVLLLGGYGGVIVTGIAIAVDCILVGLDWAEAFASLQYSGRQVEVMDEDDGRTQQASATAYTYDYFVDASLSLCVDWILDDLSNEGHALTITAEAEYYEYNIYGEVIDKPPVTTSATLNVKPDNQIDGQTLYEGTYSWLYLDLLYDDVDSYYVYVTEGQGIFVEMNPPPDMDFDLYLYDPYGTLKDESVTRYPGYTEQVGVQADTSGYWKVTVAAWSGFGFYSLEIDLNNPPNTPSKPSGSISGETGTSYTYSTSTTDPDGDNISYECHWRDGSYTQNSPLPSGSTVYVSNTWYSPGTYYVKVRAKDVYGAWSDYSSSLTVTITGDPISGGGCPFLYVYDGEEYFCEGLLDIHNPEGIDVIYGRTLVTTPQRENGAYLLRLTEHPQTHSYIDEVKLYAILEDGTMVELPLISARHSEYGNVLPQLLFSDEWKTDTLGANLNNGTSQSIDLKFAALYPNMNIASFVFQIEGNNIAYKL